MLATWFLSEVTMLPQISRPRAAIATALYGAVALALQDASASNFDVLSYVNPLIGTAKGGALSRHRLLQSEHGG